MKILLEIGKSLYKTSALFCWRIIFYLNLNKLMNEVKNMLRMHYRNLYKQSEAKEML